ncbi:hypothetical protein ACS0PU_011175 [Formica fusca]
MNRKRPRKDISDISKRQLSRLVKQESEFISKSVLNMTAIPSHKNIKRTNNVENILEINSDMTDIQSDAQVIEKDNVSNEGNKNNDMLVKYEYFNTDEYINEHNLNSPQCMTRIPCEESITHVTSENAELAINSNFKNDLVIWATEYQIKHNALKALLLKLKQHSCFSTLLIDPRSFLKTPRTQTLRVVVPGIYYHFGLRNVISDALTLQKDNIDCVKITINIDGLPLSKSSQQQFWPILGSVLPYNNVFIIGIYYGNEKPADANGFIQDFINEAIQICENDIYIDNRNIQCRIEALICDAPAKAFVLCIKGHSGYSSCTKCIIEGEYIKNRICFPQTDAPLRTDEDFMQKVDDNYHNPDVTCSLLQIPHFKPVTNVPLDYMHLVCLGIMRKLMYLWLDGDLHYRVQHRAVKEISTRLLTQLKPSIPSEFARKPRGIDCIRLWKATEYRLILLYTGPLAFKSILKNKVYTHFMIFHVIIRIMSSKVLHEYLSYAQELILFFIEMFIKLYGTHNVSHNVHNLIHLVEDVRKFGSLDNFSAFKFENYMQTLKKLLRKSEKPLQQVVRRCTEKEINLDISPLRNISSDSILTHPNVVSLHCDGPLTSDCKNPQYKVIKYSGITFKAGTLANNCCGLSDGTIVCIENVAHCKKRNIPMIIGYEFLEKKNLFDVPCPSSLLGIYSLHLLSHLKSWPLETVIRKYVKLPCANNEFAVFPLLHIEM